MYSIEYNNTDIKKLWMLVRNGIFDKRTVNKIINQSSTDKLIFSSKYTFEKFNKLRYTTIAMYAM